MDFILDVPRSDEYTRIMTVVDKLSKRANHIPLTDKIKVSGIPHLFYKETYKHHGLPRVLISIQDNRFTS